jgi:hypothetical protein
MPKDGIIPSAESIFLSFIDGNIRDGRFRDSLLRSDPVQRVTALRKHLTRLLDQDSNNGLLVNVYARALVLAILAKASSGLSETDCRKEMCDVVRHFVTTYPMKQLPDAKRELLRALVDLWQGTGRGLMDFERYTFIVARLQGENVDVVHNLLRHGRYDSFFRSEARSLLRTVHKGDPRWPCADKLVKALDFNLLANMGDEGRHCFADLSDCLDRAPGFVRDELMAMAKRYEHLFGLEESFLEVLERELFACGINTDGLATAVRLIPFQDGGISLQIDITGEKQPAKLADWANCLATDLLPRILKNRAEILQAPKNLGFTSIDVLFSNRDKIGLKVLAHSTLK